MLKGGTEEEEQGKGKKKVEMEKKVKRCEQWTLERKIKERGKSGNGEGNKRRNRKGKKRCEKWKLERKIKKKEEK